MKKMNLVSNGDEDFSETIIRYNATATIERGEARLRSLGMQQTRFLCGYRCMGPMASTFSQNRTGEEEGRFLLGLALRNLAEINAVGVLERFNELIPQVFFLPGLSGS